MVKVSLIMPKMGESVTEATILKWLKKPGDKVRQDEPLLEIATDKVDSEIPSPSSGVLKTCLFAEGQVVQVGTVIGEIETESGVAAEPSVPAPPPVASRPEPVSVSNGSSSAEPVLPARSGGGGARRLSPSGKFLSPLVRSIAQQEGVTMAEIDVMKGSGHEGRVTRNDLLAFVASRAMPSVQQAVPETRKAVQPPSSIPSGMPSGGEYEIIEMDRMRKLIAEHMVFSKHTSPHVTSFVEADVTNIVSWRERIKTEFEKREKEKITYTPVFIDAVVKAIRDFPLINVSVEGTRIIVKKNINIGMAAALPSGNLIVPVIRNADHLNLLGLTKAVNDLASRTRGNKLQPDEIQGGTFTLTNVGTFGNLLGTPIINQPQVAILATGAIKKKPVVIETPEGDTIGIRHMMFLSLSYDHRVVDGSLGGSFLRRIADHLEQFDPSRTI